MNYKIKKGTNEKVFIMFHGTGGDADSLLPISNHLDANATYIGLEGNVLEYGARRFFKRSAVGVYDYANLLDETHIVSETIDRIILEHQLSDKKIYLIGYSNGANMIQSLLKVYPNKYTYMILLHPSLLKDESMPELSQTNIFLSTSYDDPYSTKEEINQLINHLKNANSNLTIQMTDQGHSITQKEVTELKKWYEKH
ncbi:Phospholipase/carboxylesterase family protein [Alteracholeplasma palmae J233]|uniref:Phospholipase/carboxylesterase family protein n=1 Tax=Alteracholeplasma palmae (strain ATCC 49389 / J233) TaxID=1318466 RepID=U4KPZ3_ALTPJ|nr:dienelactone hydrolase family protein [Alteracholeplasma palmae]CCV64370.1 Phospholipase/carboxylesterase family protein [Alteracholeplasma palmae J233]